MEVLYQLSYNGIQFFIDCQRNKKMDNSIHLELTAILSYSRSICSLNSANF